MMMQQVPVDKNRKCNNALIHPGCKNCPLQNKGVKSWQAKQNIKNEA